MMRRFDSKSDQNTRSLLQKAIRRGAFDVAELAVIRLIQNEEISWLRSRLAVIAFEECWGMVGGLEFAGAEDNLIQQYRSLASSSKDKNAAGLGSLAYELSKGQQSVLSKGDPQDRHIKLMAEAIKRPMDFWRWIKNIDIGEDNKNLIIKAELGYKLAGWPWDKAFAQAAAYLSVAGELPETSISNRNGGLEFPYWVAIDKHTSSGKRALIKCAEKFGIDKVSLGWVQFYLESAKCEGLKDCYWWDREKEWRLSCEGFSLSQAAVVWADVSEYVIELVSVSELKMIESLSSSFLAYKALMNQQGKLI